MSKRFLKITNSSGSKVFGELDEMKSRGLTIPAGVIYLYHGDRRFGLQHIWDKHHKTLVSLGYDSQHYAAQYVEDILQPQAEIFCEFDRNPGRPIILKRPLGIVVLEYRDGWNKNYESHHSVVTAFRDLRPKGVKIGVF